MPDLTPISQTELEEMEVYQVLKAGIDDDSTLDEMLTAFSAMCKVPIEVTTDMYLLEISQGEYEGQKYLFCSISRQMEIPGYYEMIDLGFTVEYPIDEDMSSFTETTFIENDWQGFLSHIRSTDFYETFLTREISARRVGISSW